MVPGAADPVLVMSVDDGEPVTGLCSLLEVTGAVPEPVGLAGMAPVSTEVTEVEVTGTVLSTVVVVETSEVDVLVLAGTMGVECELSVLRPEVEGGDEEGNGLGSVEAREYVCCADSSTDRAFREPDVDAEDEDSGREAGAL